MKANRFFYGWWIVAGMFAAMMLSGGAGFYIFGILYTPLMDEFGWSRADIAATVTIYLACHGLASPLVGRLTDRFGSRAVVLWSAFIVGASFFSLYFTQSLIQFYLTYGLIGAAMAGSAGIPVNAAINNWFVKKYGLAVGIAATGISIGAMALTQAAAFIIHAMDWRSTFVFLGATAWLLVIPIVFFKVRNRPDQMGLKPLGHGDNGSAQASQTADQTAPDGLWLTFKQPAAWLAVASFLAVYANIFIVLQHLVNFLGDKGISALTAASALGLTGLMGGAGKILFGMATDRFSPVRVMAVNCLLQAVGVFLLIQGGGMAQVWGFVVVFGIAMGGQPAIQPVIVSRLSRRKYFGTVYGIATLFVAVGGGVAPYLAGVCRDRMGTYLPVFYASVGLAVLAAVFILISAWAQKRPCAPPVSAPQA